jgi:hypothetical protein
MFRFCLCVIALGGVLGGATVCAQEYGGTQDYGQPGALTTPGYYSPRPSYMSPAPRLEPNVPRPASRPLGQAWDPRYPGNPGFQPGPPQHYERQYDGHYGAGGGTGPWDRP